ncbi:MAG TPA: hypothetical protein DEQ47_09090 [Solibacterales bacterium]|jgi:hypothetical protein|nr:hypothetical protein [Bryobacterales bacterium]
MKITRRQLLVSAAAGGVVSSVVAPPAPAQEAAPQDWLVVARQTIRRNAELLAAVDVPPGTEPAFVFRP